jgi:CDP-4-dehydro-6-deoxyglucose reductase, E1
VATSASRVPAGLDWPLMRNNISREDLDAVIHFLRAEDPILTQGPQVQAFEREWSKWIGVPHSVFVNSGSSANLITLGALRHMKGSGQVIVPTLTWVSDISAILHNGFEPIFVDIDPKTLGMDNTKVLDLLTDKTRAVFLTHILGYNALTTALLEELARRNIPLIEDVCESYGATFTGRKLGTFGWVSNFSFYYAHHLSTIEGGMVSTSDPDLYQIIRMLRAHGLVRESNSEVLKNKYVGAHPDLNPDFIFAYPAYNVRSTEINAVIGRSQLPKLDKNNWLRSRNLALFLRNLDPDLYRTDFLTEGNSNYALTLVLKKPDPELCARVMQLLRRQSVEFRRGSSGGGNQLRQPYLRERFPSLDPASFREVDHVHFYGFYIGNYPTLEKEKIRTLCRLLNELAPGN